MDALLSSRKHLYIMATALCLVVLMGGWFLLISPKKAQVADLRTQADAQESSNNGLRSQVQALQVLEAKLPQQQAALARMQAKVPAVAALPDLLRVLTKAATDSGVKLVGVTPTPPIAVQNASGVSGIDVTLRASGDYVSLEQYELALEQLPRAFLVNGMTIAPGTTAASGSTPAASGSTTASSGSTSGSADALTATINGRILLQTAPAAISSGTSTSRSATTGG